MFRIRITSALLLLTSVASAQSPRPYDGIQAGLDAFRLAEESRQIVAHRQIVLSNDLKYWPPPWIAYGPPFTYGYAFPIVRGTNFGTPMRQPVSQVQIQTGPNRWESHPVYDPPLLALLPLPPVNDPLLDRTPYAPPPPLAIEPPPPPLPTPPPPPPHRGQRER